MYLLLSKTDNEIYINNNKVEWSKCVFSVYEDPQFKFQVANKFFFFFADGIWSLGQANYNYQPSPPNKNLCLS